MRRVLTIALLVSAGSMVSSNAVGGPLGSMWRNFWAGFRYNNEWPAQFVDADREAVRAPFRVMVFNGWRRQNTLTDDHFNEQNTEMTQAGWLKVRWVLTQVPEEYRTIYIQKTAGDELLAKRIEIVQDASREMLGTGEIANVVPTHIDPMGWPAETVDAIERRYVESAPAPRLPESENRGLGD